VNWGETHAEKWYQTRGWEGTKNRTKSYHEHTFYPKEYRTMNIFDRKENRTLKTYVNKMQTGGDPGPIRLG